MKLFVTESEKSEAAQLLIRAGLDSGLDRPAAAGKPPLILLNPGAQFGAAKCWPADYFAALGDRLIEQLGATVLISAAPKEKRIVEAIKAGMKNPAVDLLQAGSTLGALLKTSSAVAI